MSSVSDENKLAVQKYIEEAFTSEKPTQQAAPPSSFSTWWKYNITHGCLFKTAEDASKTLLSVILLKEQQFSQEDIAPLLRHANQQTLDLLAEKLQKKGGNSCLELFQTAITMCQSSKQSQLIVDSFKKHNPSQKELLAPLLPKKSGITSWCRYNITLGCLFSKPQKCAEKLLNLFTEKKDLTSLAELLRHASPKTLQELQHKIGSLPVDNITKEDINTLFHKAIVCASKPQQREAIANVALKALENKTQSVVPPPPPPLFQGAMPPPPPPPGFSTAPKSQQPDIKLTGKLVGIGEVKTIKAETKTKTEAEFAVAQNVRDLLIAHMKHEVENNEEKLALQKQAYIEKGVLFNGDIEIPFLEDLENLSTLLENVPLPNKVRIQGEKEKSELVIRLQEKEYTYSFSELKEKYLRTPEGRALLFDPEEAFKGRFLSTWQNYATSRLKIREEEKAKAKAKEKVRVEKPAMKPTKTKNTLFEKLREALVVPTVIKASNISLEERTSYLFKKRNIIESLDSLVKPIETPTLVREDNTLFPFLEAHNGMTLQLIIERIATKQNETSEVLKTGSLFEKESVNTGKLIFDHFLLHHQAQIYGYAASKKHPIADFLKKALLENIAYNATSSLEVDSKSLQNFYTHIKDIALSEKENYLRQPFQSLFDELRRLPAVQKALLLPLPPYAIVSQGGTEGVAIKAMLELSKSPEPIQNQKILQEIREGRKNTILNLLKTLTSDVDIETETVFLRFPLEQRMQLCLGAFRFQEDESAQKLGRLLQNELLQKAVITDENSTSRSDMLTHIKEYATTRENEIFDPEIKAAYKKLWELITAQEESQQNNDASSSVENQSIPPVDQESHIGNESI